MGAIAPTASVVVVGHHPEIGDRLIVALAGDPPCDIATRIQPENDGLANTDERRLVAVLLVIQTVVPLADVILPAVVRFRPEDELLILGEFREFKITVGPVWVPYRFPLWQRSVYMFTLMSGIGVEPSC